MRIDFEQGKLVPYEIDFEQGKLVPIDTKPTTLFNRCDEIQLQGYSYPRYVILSQDACRGAYYVQRIIREGIEEDTEIEVTERRRYVQFWEVEGKDSTKKGICFKATGHTYSEEELLKLESEYEESLIAYNKALADIEATRKETIEKGKEIYLKLYGDKKPISIYIAEHHKNESDGMTDYFGSRVTDSILLGVEFEAKKFSFATLKKLAHKTKVVDKIGLLDEENRENYSGGNGNYLTGKDSNRYSGWQAFRTSYFNMSSIYLSLGEFSDHLVTAPTPESKSEPKPTQPQPETIGNIQIIDYSDKAIAIIGDTKPIKDKLMELGCKFNPRLSCGPGWIASKKNLDTIKKELGLA